MPTIVSARSLRAINVKLPFCYVCGNHFEADTSPTRDHVPSSSCFAVSDRVDRPLILPTHKGCNERFKIADEVVGQYLSILHGKTPAPHKNRLKWKTVTDVNGRSSMALPSVDMYGTVYRWLRAFHAALYQQPMPPTQKYAIELPMTVVSPIGDTHVVDTGRAEQRSLCEETIKRNRQTQTLDRLAAWNGKLRYECVWVITPLHAYCVFWLDLYNWGRLARIAGRQPADCVGFYCLFLDELPIQATQSTQVLTGIESGARFAI